MPDMIRIGGCAALIHPTKISNINIAAAVVLDKAGKKKFEPRRR